MSFELPDRWQSSRSLEGAPTGVVSQTWLTHFNAPELKGWVDQALKKNYDLQKAAVMVLRRSALLAETGANLWPTLDAGVQAGQRKTPVKIETGTGSNVKKIREDQYGLSLSLSWEIDLWGRLRNLKRSAAADWAAANTDYSGARLSLAAQVAKAWLEWRLADELVLQAEKTEANYALAVRKIEDRFNRGLVSALDLRLARSDHAVARNTTFKQRRRRLDAGRLLQLLAGDYPDGKPVPNPAMGKPGPSWNMFQLKQTVPAGLPLALLERRPDIVAARQRLAAADEQVAASRKSFLPNMSLTGKAGTSSDALRKATNAEYLAWDLLANLTQPIFRGGRLKAALQRARADAQEAWIDYAQTVSRALFEVEQALDYEKDLFDRLAVINESAVQAEMAQDLAMKNYTAGQVDVLTVLEARRRALVARNEWFEALGDHLKNRVDLYLALGGGFQREKPS